MNHAYIRPGRRRAGPARRRDRRRSATGSSSSARNWSASTSCCAASRSGCKRLKDVGWIGVEGCIALGVTGPMLRAAGLPWDLRKTEPYLGYETFDFEVPTDDRGDCWSRFVVQVAEMWESLQDRRAGARPPRARPDDGRRPEDRAGRPSSSLGPDGMGNSLEHVQKIMNTLDGVADPPLQAGDRGLPGPAGPGLHGGRVATRRARRARGQRRRHAAVPRAPARAVSFINLQCDRRAVASAAWSPT